LQSAATSSSLFKVAEESIPFKRASDLSSGALKRTRNITAIAFRPAANFSVVNIEFAAVNEEFFADKEEFAAVNEEFFAVKEEFAAVNEEFFAVNEEFSATKKEFFAETT